MELIDLTRDIRKSLTVKPPHAAVKEVHLHSDAVAYTGLVYDFSFSSMAGTYLDFPGHIRECNNGMEVGSCPVSMLYRQAADHIHLCRRSGSGGVGADELRDALQPGNGDSRVLIINALGELDCVDIEQRTVFLEHSAVEWIIEQGYNIVISDIYESRQLDGVFFRLFSAGVITVCEPVNLYLLQGLKVEISIFPLYYTGITQLPCRVIAEITEYSE